MQTAEEHALSDDIRTILGALGDLREDIADHRGEVREAIAEIRGTLDAITKIKALEHDRIDGAAEDVRRRVTSTEEQVAAVTKRMDRMVWVGLGIGFGSSLGGGGVAYGLSLLLGG